MIEETRAFVSLMIAREIQTVDDLTNMEIAALLNGYESSTRKLKP